MIIDIDSRPVLVVFIKFFSQQIVIDIFFVSCKGFICILIYASDFSMI